MQAPLPPPPLKLGTHYEYDSDNDLDFLHNAAPSSDDFFSDDVPFSPTGGSPFAFRDDKNLHDLNQAYSNLSIDDFVGLDQDFGDTHSSQDLASIKFSPKNFSQDLDTLPLPNSPKQQKKKHQIEQKNDFSSPDSTFQAQACDFSDISIDVDQDFGEDMNSSQDVTKFEFSPSKMSKDQATSLFSTPEKQPQIGDEANHGNAFRTLNCIFQDQILNSILSDDAEFEDFDDFLDFDVQSDTDLHLADDCQAQADDVHVQADNFPAQAQDKSEKQSNFDPNIFAHSPIFNIPIINEFPQQSEPEAKLQKRKACQHKSEQPKSRKCKSSKRKCSKRKPDNLSLGELRKTKWRRGDNDIKMKRGVYQVRVCRRKIRVVAEEEGMNERALRRYVHISMDPRKQTSGYYIPVQPDEKIPKCLRSIVKPTC